MMKSLLRTALVAVAFIQLKDPADNSPLFVTNDDAEKFGATKHDDGFARDSAGNKLPIGVRVHGAGSKVFRKAEDDTNDAMLKAKGKGLTGAGLRNSGTYKLAKCTEQFVNFGYALTEGGPEIRVTPDMAEDERIRVASAFYDDLRFAAFREQIEKDQADHANFTPKA
jgi:hypothetical protein